MKFTESIFSVYISVVKKVILYLLLWVSSVYATDYCSGYIKPATTDFFTLGPQTLKTAWNKSFSREALPAWGAIFASTAVLYYYDEKILLELQRFGRRVGLGNDDHTKGMLSIGDFNIFRGPTDAGSWMYFLGDGWMHTFIATGFLATGAFTRDNRALQTGSQILHGMIYSTIPNQILKRSFGRESPYRRTTTRGKWRPFPSISTYNSNISKYDAMPSGHIMTATMTWTVIDSNYPEYRWFIRPLAYTWVTLLGFQMVNNGVHWASDYPLGIGMGYLFGKIATRYGHESLKQQQSNQPHWDFIPYSYTSNHMRDRLYGINIYFSF